MEDYEVTEIKDLITHFASFSDYDLITFQSIVKDAKWHKTMDDEIEAIERNEIVQSANEIFISQKKYAQEILDRFQLKVCNPVSTLTEFGLKLNQDYEGKKVDNSIYKQIVDSLMYLTLTMSDIMCSISLISRYMENLTEIDLLVIKRILRYLQGTKDFELFYKKGEKLELFRFINNDYTGDQDDRRSTSGYAFILGTGARGEQKFG
ncbi:uncharacterized mitochondrial protein AtMg00810-like [Zingiber officinale]|uniref:uncharacterized mitochondrial protein AtMg00810-like n=1 Tax=Zingiber officinale TaxID=94328 RepID=UPI001C4BF3CC|nr:uncharacterized mitochondrial protein AtMg00810-like [Zingiber officinale]